MSLEAPTPDVANAIVGGKQFPQRRALSLATSEDTHVQTVTVYMNTFNPENVDDKVVIEFHKRSTTEELIDKILATREECSTTSPDDYEIFETLGTLDGRTFKERRLDKGEYPVAIQNLWPRHMPTPSDDATSPKTRFVMRHKGSRPSQGGNINFVSTESSSTIDSFLAKFLVQPQDREYADLCMLPELTEQTLLDNLKDRFNSGHIYTYIGPILVAVNPFNFFPIYNPKYAQLYSQSRRLGALPPHIFAIADITYHSMLRIKQNQCVVISGESGSGKTESTNHCLHHLTTLSQKSSDGSSVEQMLLAAGPVLEAFGNAVNLQNNNSSRFGKFIKVNYRENGMISGANVEIYLLEKSRIISQAEGERNYHVFYYLLEGATDEERARHFLLKPRDYYYLNQNDVYTREGVDEADEFKHLKTSMEAIGFSKTSQQKIFGMISAVLLLGNTQFTKRVGYHMDENAFVENVELVDIIGELLDIQPKSLVNALSMRRTVLRNDMVITRYTVAEAINTRDAMAKCLYNALFHWIVLKMNQALIKRDASRKKGFYIGILDIFGFEDVGSKWNSFEQLCINYANEHLQAYFNQHIFQFEQEEYLKENITWTNIEYTDNTECVHLFQSKPYGLLRLIDEESNINNGTDQSMLDKLNTFLRGNEYYETPHKREDAFIVAHYAGKVKYQIKGFREKNKDLMRHDVMAVLKNSKSAFVRELVGIDPVAVYRWNLLRCTFRAMFAFRAGAMKRRVYRAQSADRLTVPDAPAQLVRRGSDSHLSAFLRGDISEDIVPDFCDTSVFKTIVERARKQPLKPKSERQSTLRSLLAVKELIGKKPVSNKPSSVSRQFEYSLSRLMKTLSQSTPYFIRCIKSNSFKIPNQIDENIIRQQLRYTGMLETVRIRRAGYSVRIEYAAFVNQYRIVLPKGDKSTREDIQQFIHDHPLIDTDSIQYGKTKIFLRDAEKLLLDDHLHRVIMDKIHTLQHWFRSCLVRKRYLRLREAAVHLQAMARGAMVRDKIRRQFDAALCIQSNWRRYLCQKRYNLIMNAVRKLQAIARGNHYREQFSIMQATLNLPCYHQGTDVETLLVLPPSEDEITASESEDFDDDDVEDEDELEDTTTQGITEDEEEEDTESETETNMDDDDDEKSQIDLDATFILEDTKLKLVNEAADNPFHRRQSLATTASTAKLRMLRRAASTETDHINRSDLLPSDQNRQIDTSEKAHKGGIGFTKARQQLKAFLTRKLDGGESTETDLIPGSSRAAKHKPSTVSVFSAAGPHCFKMSRLHKAEICALCGKVVSSLFVQGYKCGVCKLSFHKECVSNASHVPCLPSSPPAECSPVLRKPWDLIRTPRQSLSPMAPMVDSANFNLTNTKMQKDSANIVVASIDELREFAIHMFKKTNKVDESKKKNQKTLVDQVFSKSLIAFHKEMFGFAACEMYFQQGMVVLKYRDVITMFEGVLTKTCNREHTAFPTTLGVNAFRGFVNDYIQKTKGRKPSNKVTLDIAKNAKKRRKSDVTLHNGHRFRLEYVHVPTYCEICNMFMWHSLKIFVCENCRISCHKKCHKQINFMCPRATNEAGFHNKFFAADLNMLVDDEHTVPIVLNKLLMTIEVQALFIEGIYRKSGALSTVRNYRKMIEEADCADTLDLEDIPVHVAATLIKSFFRELLEPLIPFELYENFLNVSEITEPGERLRCLSAMVDMLPKNNKAVLDRLMYHLARVAHQEEVNRMSASNLAVIFAPCILRRNIVVHAQEQLLDVQKQVICVQALIEEKLKQYRETLCQIIEIEHASEKVTENLRRIEAHRRASNESAEPSGTIMPLDRKPIGASRETLAEPSTPLPSTRSTSNSMSNIETARQLFIEQLEFLDKEKEKLIQELPPLAPVASIEDLSSSDVEHSSPSPHSRRDKTSSGRYGDDDEDERAFEYALDLTGPPIYSKLPHSYIRTRTTGDLRRRLPTWGQKVLADACSPRTSEDQVVFKLTFDERDESV